MRGARVSLGQVFGGPPGIVRERMITNDWTKPQQHRTPSTWHIACELGGAVGFIYTAVESLMELQLYNRCEGDVHVCGHLWGAAELGGRHDRGAVGLVAVKDLPRTEREIHRAGPYSGPASGL